jgi:hypothetical protein
MPTEPNGPESQSADDACPNCGAAIPDGRTHCPECGAMSLLESIRRGRTPTGELAAWPGADRTVRPLTGSSTGDVALGFVGFVAAMACTPALADQVGSWLPYAAGYCGGLAAMAGLRRRYPDLTRGIGVGLIAVAVLVVLVILGGLVVCVKALNGMYNGH